MKEKTMNYGQDIYDSLANYIVDDRYHQAVLLDGPWGSGKTWFIRKYFIPEFEASHQCEEWHFIYLSLYGLETVEEVKAKKDRLVAEQLLGQFFRNHGLASFSGEGCIKKARLLKPVVSLLSSYLPKDLPDIKIEDVLGALDKPEHVVLILDDLERAHIKPEIVLGYISELTEQEDTKVIVLANEEEVCQMNGLEETDEEGKPPKKNPKRERYDSIKEKSIGLDIKYEVPVAELYSEIVNEYVKSEPLKKYIHEEKDYIVTALETNESNNLRTLIFAFVACDTVYPLLVKVYDSWRVGHEEETQFIFDELVRDVVRYTLQCALSRERGESCTTPGFVFDEAGHLQVVRYYSSYSFVRSFIAYRRIPEEELQRNTFWVLDDLLDGSQKRNEAYHKLMRWWLLDDCDIERYLEKLEGEILRKRLNPDYIRSLFVALIGISEAGIDVPMEKYSAAIIANLKKSGPILFTVDLLYATSDIGDLSIRERYNEALRPIYKLVRLYFEERQKEAYQFLIRNEWGLDFKRKCKEKMPSFMDDRRFLAYVDPEEVLQKIKVSTPAEICYFTDGIRSIYVPANISDFYKADVPCIEAILKGMGEMEDLEGKVKKWNVQKLEDVLRRSKDMLS